MTTTTDPMDLYISDHCDQKSSLNLAIAQAVACVPGRITVHGTPNTAAFVAGIRPKWYPTIERPKATVFTPKELEEWNQGKVGPHAESKR